MSSWEWCSAWSRQRVARRWLATCPHQFMPSMATNVAATTANRGTSASRPRTRKVACRADLEGEARLDQGEQRYHGDGEKDEIAAVDQLCPGQQGAADDRPALLGGQQHNHGHYQGGTGQAASGRGDGSPKVAGGQQVTQPDHRQPGRQPGNRQDTEPDGGTGADRGRQHPSPSGWPALSKQRRRTGTSWKWSARARCWVRGPTADGPG